MTVRGKVRPLRAPLLPRTLPFFAVLLLDMAE